MTQPNKSSKGIQADQRQARLAAALRANLKKRKDQARGSDAAKSQAIGDPGRDHQGKQR
jgi:hypothetical protein